MTSCQDVSDFLREEGLHPDTVAAAGATVVATFSTQAAALDACNTCKVKGFDAVQFGSMLVFGRRTPKAEMELRPLAAELAHARQKFPANRYLFTALAEEIGEMADAWCESPGSDHARHEAVQVACVAMRIASEGTLDDESSEVLKALMDLEPMARKFFASLNRPDLTVRSDPEEHPVTRRSWTGEEVKAAYNSLSCDGETATVTLNELIEALDNQFPITC